MAEVQHTPGTTFTKTITRGPNKGDRVVFKVAPGGHPYPIRVLRDVGAPSTLRDNPDVKFPGDKDHGSSHKGTEHTK